MFETAEVIVKYNQGSKDSYIQTLVNGLTLGIQENNPHIVKKFLDQYNEYMDKIWKSEMTNPKEYEEGKPFKFIVHNLTKDDFYDEFRTELVSSSLITDKALCVCGKHKIGFTLAPYNIKAAVPYDLFTINDYFQPSFHYKDYENRPYHEAFSCPGAVLSPEIVETDIIKQTVEKNGEILNSYASKVFSEVIIDGWCPTAIYTITNGEKEISPDYRRAQDMNKIYMFNYLDIDKSVYRMQNGLEPLTKQEQIDLANNLLEYTQTSVENIEELYLKIYKLFLKLKERGLYSTDRFVREFQKIKK